MKRVCFAVLLILTSAHAAGAVCIDSTPWEVACDIPGGLLGDLIESFSQDHVNRLLVNDCPEGQVIAWLSDGVQLPIKVLYPRETAAADLALAEATGFEVLALSWMGCEVPSKDLHYSLWKAHQPPAIIFEATAAKLGGAQEFCLGGEVSAVFRIPSLAAWDVLISREPVMAPGSLEFIDTVCEDSVAHLSRSCETLAVGSVVEVCGFIRSNEPNTGIRLSVTRLHILSDSP